MIQDPTDRYIAAILSQWDIRGREVLEIGCGRGRITRDLARHANRVVATDPDASSLEAARTSLPAANVAFILTPSGVPDLPAGSFDLVIYTLSFHHVPVAEMSLSLRTSAALLRKNGAVVILEPGDGGSFTEAKERFGAGSGNERPARDAAVRAMHDLEGWTVGDTLHFQTYFLFTDNRDFISSMLPGFDLQPASRRLEILEFLDAHRTAEGILLDADRRLNLLQRIL